MARTRTLVYFLILLGADFFLSKYLIVDDVGDAMEKLVHQCPEFVKNTLSPTVVVMRDIPEDKSGRDSFLAVVRYLQKNLQEVYQEGYKYYSVIRNRWPRMETWQQQDKDLLRWMVSAIPASILHYVPQLGTVLEQSMADGDEQKEVAAEPPGGEESPGNMTATAMNGNKELAVTTEVLDRPVTVLPAGEKVLAAVAHAAKAPVTPLQMARKGFSKVFRAAVVGMVVTVMVILESMLYFMP